MKAKDLTITFSVDKTPMEVYNTINNVRGWWSDSIEGGTTKLNDEFIYRYKDMHYSTQRLVEMVPGKKIVWLITDSALTFIKDQGEWNGTKVVFDISGEGSKTKIQFTHVGLVPECECFTACSGGWNHYINKSLLPLLTKGVGQPN